MMHFRHHGNGKMVPDVKIILRGDSVIKKEMIAMLLAGGQGKPSRCPDFKSGKAGGSIRRQISY